MLDEHCHIIYGVDDGSPTREESLAMLDAAKAVGITQMVCTPHMRWDDFSMETVQQRFADLKEEGQARGIDMSLGFEVYYNTLMAKGLKRAPRYAWEDGRTILLEFRSGGEVPFGWEKTVYTLQCEYGLDVVIAHPERYSSVQQDFGLVERMLQADCRIQVSAGDMFGGMFDKCKKTARRIMKENLGVLVSDAHCAGHYADFTKALSLVK